MYNYSYGLYKALNIFNFKLKIYPTMQSFFLDSDSYPWLVNNFFLNTGTETELRNLARWLAHKEVKLLELKLALPSA